MLAKDKYSLESIIESIDGILEYTAGIKSADDALSALQRNTQIWLRVIWDLKIASTCA